MDWKAEPYRLGLTRHNREDGAVVYPSITHIGNVRWKAQTATGRLASNHRGAPTLFRTPGAAKKWVEAQNA